MRKLLAALLFLWSGVAASAWNRPPQDASVFEIRPPDPSSPTFTCAQDGQADCTTVLQASIDDLQERQHYGVLYIPEGRYRLTGTVHVWAGIRLVGFGRQRPVFVVPASSAAFEKSDAPTPLLWFVHERPKPNHEIQEGTSDTFYSGLLNVDIEVGGGNPGAVGVRFHVAQHGLLQHSTIRMKSGHSALQNVGNLANDLHLIGGDYGIDTIKTAPGWPFVLMDSTIEDQSRAAIRTREAGMTLVRVRLRHAPTGVEVPSGQIEELYLRDSSFEQIGTAIEPGEARNVRSQISADDVRCLHVDRLLPATPVSAQVPGRRGDYTVERLRLGVAIGTDGRGSLPRLQYRDHPGVSNLPASDVMPTPSVADWVNVRTLGATGDGFHDDHAALQRAIDSHRALFFPAGRYRLTGSLHLHSDSSLLGLNPFTTQLVLADHTPEFAGTGPPLPLLEVPPGAASHVGGIGISTGVFNPRAMAAQWSGGERSLLEDVKFFGGRGTLDAKGQPLQIYSAGQESENRTAGLDTQSPSLVVRGGGVFRAIWSASGFARAGLWVEGTTVPGRVYGFSCEHHLHHEVVLRQASHWRFFGLQTEEEAQDGKDAVALELDHVSDVALANLFEYRVSRSLGPADHAITLGPQTAATFANVHIFAGGRYAFDNSFLDQRSDLRSRVREFASFEASAPFAPSSQTRAKGGGALRRLAGGFTDATALTEMPDGDVLFVDPSAHRLLRWATGESEVRPIDLRPGILPVTLARMAPDRVVLLDTEHRAFSVDPAGRLSPEPLPLQSRTESPERVLPVGGHSGLRSLRLIASATSGISYADSEIPLPSDVRPLLYGSQFSQVTADMPFLTVSEEDATVSRITLGVDGQLSEESFGWVAGSAVVQTADGRTFVAGEQLLELGRDGRVIATIELPSRPTALLLGGPKKSVLYIGARSALFALPIAP